MRMEPRHLLILTCAMVAYLCIGAAVFNALEARNERARKEELENDIDGFLSKWIFVILHSDSLASFRQASKTYLFQQIFNSLPLFLELIFIIIIIIIYPLTTRVVGAPQMISQPVFSIFPCSPLPSGTWRTPGLSIPWCCLPSSSSVCLVFFRFSLCLARWFWPDLMNERHDHTTTVCVSLRSSGGLRVVQLPAESWHGLPCW